MTKQIDFNRYEHFVDAVTSDASKDFLSLSDRLVELDQKGANIERLMTASVGMSAEAGEFTEIVKKMVLYKFLLLTSAAYSGIITYN